MNESNLTTSDQVEQAEPKSRKTRFLGILFVAIIAFGALTYIFLNESRTENSAAGSNATSTATTTMTVNGVTFIVPVGSNVKIEQVGSADIGPAPSTNKLINYPAFYDQATKLAFSEQLSQVKGDLAKNPYSYDDWVKLGLLWNSVQDYQGAKLAWEYASKIAPESFLSFGDLGFLYGYRLHDPAKAEADFLTAIKNGPDQAYLYEQTFEFYRDVLKNPVKAKAIADQGEKATGQTNLFESLKATLK